MMSDHSYFNNDKRKVTILLDEDIGYYRFEVLALLFSTIGDLLNDRGDHGVIMTQNYFGVLV